MFIQGGAWIIGTLLIFAVLFAIGRGVLSLFCPESRKEKAEKKLKKKIEQLEYFRQELETKKLEAVLGGELFEIETEIAKTDDDLDKLKQKLKQS